VLRFLIVRACLLVVFVLAAASALEIVASLTPGDELAELRASGVSGAALEREIARRGLDRSWTERYLQWLGRAARFDFGVSTRYDRPVAPLVAYRAANTAILAVTALALAVLVGLPLGALAGSGRFPWLSVTASTLSLVIVSVPPLVTALTLALIAARTGWLPAAGMTTAGLDAGTPMTSRAADIAMHLVVPAIALALPIGAMLERVQAAAVAAGRAEYHVVAAAARGAPPMRLLWRAMWRPTAGPVAAFAGVVAGSLLSGSLAVELVTAWPGMGRLTFEALSARDAPLAAGCAAAAAVLLAVWTTMSEIAARWLDPRLEESGK
jgi:peptide/nickel transport system permease protein